MDISHIGISCIVTTTETLFCSKLSTIHWTSTCICWHYITEVLDRNLWQAHQAVPIREMHMPQRDDKDEEVPQISVVLQRICDVYGFNKMAQMLWFTLWAQQK